MGLRCLPAIDLGRTIARSKPAALPGAEIFLQYSLRGFRQWVSFRLRDFHDRSLSRGQKLSRRATEERGCKSFLILRRVRWPLSRGSYFG